MKKIFTLLLAFCVAFTALPFMSGTLTADAASKITLKASAYGQNGAKLSWNKVSSPSNGYAVFRDGKPIKHYGKSTKAFTDSGLKSGSSHSYQIKTYKKSTKTQWYNKKTKKWQSKKPAKKYRGKSRKVVTYSYKKSSNKVSIRTSYAYYTITWENWDGKTLDEKDAKQGDTPSYKGKTPSRPDDSNYTYAFKGWSPSITAASKDTTYTAQYKATRKPASPAETVQTYTITWKNWNGSTLQIDDVKKGETPSYKGNTPVKPADDNYTYTFTGWTPNIAAATKNATYTAQYKATANTAQTYSIIWKNWNGSTLQIDDVKKGEMPSYKGNTPVKPADDNYTYTFTGWTPSITHVTGKATYTAQFKATAKPAPSEPSVPSEEPTSLAAPTGVTVQIVNGNYFKISWNAVSGATGYRVHKYQTGVSKESTNVLTRTYSTDEDVTEGETYYYTVTAVKDNTSSEESEKVSALIPITRETKTVTNYRGTVTQIYKNSNESFWRQSDNDVKIDTMAAFDKTVDGSFTNYENHSMIQYHGATFDITEISKLGEEVTGSYPVTMYNGDTTKLEITADAEIEPLNTYFSNTGNSGIAPITRYYYIKNGRRIAKANNDGTMLKTSSSGNTTTYTVTVDTWGSIGTGLGIYTDIIHFTVKYDDKEIATFGIDTAKDYMDKGTPQDGMSGRRRLYLDIAQAAMAKYGDSGNLHTDLRNIEKYIAEEYYYGEAVKKYNTTLIMNCADGATVLETWAIWRYNQWGFPVIGEGGNSSHVTFRLLASPYGTYYEAQGKKDGSDSGGDDDFGYYF